MSIVYVCIVGILKDVHSNFVAQFDYPVIVFHEPDFTVSLQDEIKRTVPNLDLYFQLVKFKVTSPFINSTLLLITHTFFFGILYTHYN